MTKGVLYNTKCYLIGGMENEDGQKWRETIENFLGYMGIKCLNPYKKPFVHKIFEDNDARAQLKKWMEDGEYDLVAERMKKVRNDDLRCCDLVDFSICRISPGRHSWGTGEELATLNREKKPIFLVIEGGKKYCPLWIMGMIPHKYIYNSVEDVLKMIDLINQGQVEIDSERWQLLEWEFR